MIKLKNIILEGEKENAALDYLTQLVKSGPFKGRVFLAGGAVRDMQLGKDPKDLDVVVTGGIDAGMEFAKWATKTIGNYKEGSNPVLYPTYGTAKFTLKGVTHNAIDLSDVDIESVATRKEKYSIGSRKPEVSGGDLGDDVRRRDFTVNSLLKDLTTGEILDLTGMGKDDIKRGMVRTPLDPDIIFTEDPLRILRAARFAMKYDWDLPMFMIRSMKKNALQLKNISFERIRDELDKMLLTNSPKRAIKLLKITGVLDYIIPEFKAAYGMTQNIHHKHDVFQHSLEVLSKTQPVLIQRLMGLFHDIGKTVTKSVTPEGKVHFYGHEEAGTDIVKDVMKRLKYPNELIAAVSKGVRNHMRLKSGGPDSFKLSDKALRKFKVEMGDELENTLDVIHADNIAHADASNMPDQIKNIRERLKNLDVDVKKPNLPINGEDLKQLGIKPGPIYSEILSKITDEWYEDPNLSRAKAIEIAKSFVS